MSRLCWITALGLLLVGTGFAFGQHRPSLSRPTGGDVYVVVEEQGKPAQKCKVLFCWTMADGKRACQIQTLVTGEIMTIVDPPLPHNAPQLVGGAPIQPREREVYCWGECQSCPSGFPTPPATAWRDCPQQCEEIVLSSTPIPSRRSAFQPFAGLQHWVKSVFHRPDCRSCNNSRVTPLSASKPMIAQGRQVHQPVPVAALPAPIEQPITITPVPANPKANSSRSPFRFLARLFPPRQSTTTSRNKEKIRPSTTPRQYNPWVRTEKKTLQNPQQQVVVEPGPAVQLPREIVTRPVELQQPPIKKSSPKKRSRPFLSRLFPGRKTRAVEPKIETRPKASAGKNSIVNWNPRTSPATPNGLTKWPAAHATRPTDGNKGKVLAQLAAGTGSQRQQQFTPAPPLQNKPPQFVASKQPAPVKKYGPLLTETKQHRFGDRIKKGIGRLFAKKPNAKRSAPGVTPANAPTANNTHQEFPGPVFANRKKIVDAAPPNAKLPAAPNVKRKVDPLTDPGQFVHLPTPPKTKKSKAVIVDPFENPRSLVAKTATQKTGSTELVDLPAPPTRALAGKAIRPVRYQGLPPGTGSVVAANNGLRTPMRILPMPIVTVPTPNRPPVPPPPQIPQAPQPTWYVNAFTPRQSGHGQAAPQYRYPNPMAGYGTHYGPMGYGQRPRPGMYHPNYAMQPRMAMPAGYHYGAANPQYAMGNPSNPTNVPRSYSGPLPPNPFQNHIQRVNHWQANYNQYPMSPYYYYGNQAMDRQGMPIAGQGYGQTGADQQLLMTLKTALSPAQREWAVMYLSEYDWRRSPHIVQGLLVAAKEDPAASVRAAAVQALDRMQVNKALLAPVLRDLKSDRNPLVIQAANQALQTAGTTPAAKRNQQMPVQKNPIVSTPDKTQATRRSNKATAPKQTMPHSKTTNDSSNLPPAPITAPPAAPKSLPAPAEVNVPASSPPQSPVFLPPAPGANSLPLPPTKGL